MEQMDSWGGEVAPADHRFGTNATFGSDEFAFEPGTFQGIAFNAREGATLVVDGEEVVTEARTVRYATDRGIFEIPTDDGGEVFKDDYSWSSVRGTWPQYRADSGNTAILSGISHSQQEPTERWRFEVDPIGNADGAFATPVVADGTVYTVSNQNEARYIGDREEFFGSLYALDAETGERLWVANDVEYAFEAPAVVDGTVYARARDGTIRALAAEDGNVAWTIEAERRGDAVGTVAGETLYVTGSDRLLRAIDLSEAREAWRFQSDIRSHGGEQTARVAAVQSGTVYYATWPRESTGSVIKGYVHAVNVTSEEELWRQSVGGAVPGTVVATEALILVRRRHSDGKNTFTDVRALDPDNGDVVWTSDRETSLPISDGYVVTDEAVYTSESRLIADDVTPEPLVGSPVVAGDIAYLASGRIGRNPETTNNAYLTAFDLSAGGVLWEKELYTADDVENPFREAANMPRDRPQLSTPSVVDNTAYIGAKTGTLYAFSWPA